MLQVPKKRLLSLKSRSQRKDLNVKTRTSTGCVGTCYLEPIVDVYEDNGEMTRYVKVQPEKVEEIVEQSSVQTTRLLKILLSPKRTRNLSASSRELF